MREFRTFRYKDASYRISIGDAGKNIGRDGKVETVFGVLTDNIIKVRSEIEDYIRLQPEFLSSLKPVLLLDGAPDAAERMARAAELTGLGPMAAVAGTIAQLSVELTAGAAAEAGFSELIVENGGDIFMHRSGPVPKDGGIPVIAGIFNGLVQEFNSLALRIEQRELPLSLCSSSGTMGHSLSLGRCDLSTVAAKNASLADAAATLGGNLVKTEADLEPAAERIAGIEGVDGVLLIKNRKIAMAGSLPALVRHRDPAAGSKITKTLRIE